MARSPLTRESGFFLARRSFRGETVTRGFVVGTHIRNIIVPVLLALVPAPAGAQTIAFQDTVYRLSEVLVEADRLSEIEEIKDRPERCDSPA